MNTFRSRVLLGLAFLFGLYIPRYSVLALLAIFALILGTPFRLPRFWCLGLPILAVFSLLHEGISLAYGFCEPSALLLNPLMFVMAYFSGLALPSVLPREGERWLFRFLIAICLGMAIFALLGGMLKPIRIEGADLLRRAPSFWDRSVYYNGPIFGLFASAGLCLIPAVMFSKTNRAGMTVVDASIAITTVGIGLVANTLFQNRSPYFALGLAFLVVIVDLLARRGARGRILRRFALNRLVLGGLIGFVLAAIFWNQIGLFLFRFQAYGLSSTGRLDAWTQVVSHIWEQPFGGRRFNLAGLSFAHNMWLDVLNDSGLVPALLLLGFFLVHLPSAIAFFRCPPSTMKHVVLCLTASILMGCMVEPLLIGSPHHFATLCLLLGLVAGYRGVPEGRERIQPA